MWGTTSYGNIHTNEASEDAESSRHIDRVDHLFMKEPLQKAYEVFLKFKLPSNHEASCLT